MSEAPQPNDPEARNPDGSLKDQAPPPVDPANPSGTLTPPKDPAEPKPPIDPAKPVVPEKYEDFKLPEGMKLEGETLTKASELFRGLGLDQAGAQTLVDFHAAQLKTATDAPTKAFEDMLLDWRGKQATDPDIGSKAAAIKENIGKGWAGLVAAAGEQGPKVQAEVAEFKQAMEVTGVGDHPAFIKIMNRVLSKFIEPGHVPGNGPAPVKAPDAAPKSIAGALYPNLS